LNGKQVAYEKRNGDSVEGIEKCKNMRQFKKKLTEEISTQDGDEDIIRQTVDLTLNYVESHLDEFGYITNDKLDDLLDTARSEGERLVIDSPDEYELYSSDELSDARESARDEVLNNPRDYNLIIAEDLEELKEEWMKEWGVEEGSKW
jgi:hypothetical protein